jgi:hypothetical protein
VDIQFFDGDSAPKARDQVRIKQIKIHPYPDRFRVYIHVQVTPFIERPNLLLSLHDEDDNVVTELSIIETMHHDMEFTLHIRNRPDPAGVYTLTADLFYDTRQPPQDRMVEGFVIPNADEENT